MYYNLRINDKIIRVKDCLYRLYNEKFHTLSIIGVFYGSEDYYHLTNLLNKEMKIELVGANGQVFAELRTVKLDDVEYHLLEDDVNFYGTFQEYAEDVEKLEDIE